MPLLLPDFKDSRCHYLTVAFGTPEGSFRPAANETMICRYGKGEALAYMRLSFDETRWPVNIDFVKRTHLGNSRVKVTHKRREVESVLHQWVGIDAEFFVFGNFSISIDSLLAESFIRISSRRNSSGYRLTAGTLETDKALLDMISWTLESGADSDELVDFTLRSSKISSDGPLKPDFMYMSHRWIENQFERFLEIKTEDSK